MNFQHVNILWLLLLIPAIAAIYMVRAYRQRRRIEQFAAGGMLERLQPERSRRRPVVKMVMICLALALFIVALANPRQGSVVAEGEQSGIDMAVCIDVSNSMLADDMRPNRLERSKQIVKSLMSQLGGDRVSLIVFAGNAYIQMPLTNDYSATRMFLDQISTDMISVQGTAIGDAIKKGLYTLGYNNENEEGKPAWEPNHSRAIVVISDGENHEDDAVGAAKKAASEGVMICCIGIGSPEGSTIPLYDQRGRMTDRKRDSEGKIITTKLNEEMLRAIARAGNGIYVHAGDNGATGSIVKHLSNLESEEFGTTRFSSYESKYQWPLGAGILCLIVEFFIGNRRNARWSMGRLIRRTTGKKENK